MMIPKNQASLAPMKARADFVAWLKVESAKDGKFMYEELEERVAAGLGGKRPWRRWRVGEGQSIERV